MADKLEFDALWREIGPHVRASIRRHHSADVALAAADLEQEVRIRVWQTLQSDRKGRFPAYYYYKVVNSAIVDCLRRHRGTLPRHQREGDDEALEGLADAGPGDGSAAAVEPQDHLEAQRRGQQLQRALAKLPADRRQAVGLFLQGFTVGEIAQLMGCDENKAHNLTYRGKKALIKSMQESEQ